MSESTISDINDLKRYVKAFRRKIMAESRLLQKHFNKTEVPVILKWLYTEDYGALVDMIPAWVRISEAEIDDHVAHRDRFRKLFDKMFLEKMREITGSATLPDGSPKRQVWDAKANALLKSDMNEFGFDNMKFFLHLFFSDSIEEVSSFTRYRNKAGYSYNVMHGVLPRLCKYDHKDNKYCVECSTFNGHMPDCPVVLEGQRRKEEERKEALAFKEQNPEIDLTGAFRKKVGKK